MIGPIAEAIEPEHTWILAGEHGRPSRDSNAGNGTGEWPVNTLVNKSAQIGQLIFQPQFVLIACLEKDRRRGTVKAEDEYLTLLLPPEKPQHDDLLTILHPFQQHFGNFWTGELLRQHLSTP
jgi:hypothetical protein